MDIRDFARWASKLTQKHIILSAEVKGTVNIIPGNDLTPDQAYEVFLTTLQANGLAVIESKDLLTIVPINIATQNSKLSGKVLHGSDVVTRILKIKYIAVAQVVAALKPLFPEPALLTPVTDGNLLMISARAGQIEQARNIVEQLDLDTGVGIDVVPLNYARASAVAQTFTGLLSKSGQGTAQSLAITVDERSNALLLAGDPIVRQRMRTLVTMLDQPQVSTTNTKVIAIRFADAEKLVGILQGVSGSALKSGQDLASNAFDTKIEFSKERNSLIITASPLVMTALEAVITQLDVRRPQVIVEALIVEVNDDIANSLGINWSSALPGNDGIFVGANTTPSGSSAATPPSLGPGLTLGFYHTGQLRGLINALKSDSAANLLSTPTIVALDNEPAQILVGSNVPFVTGQSTSAASSTQNPFQTIERKDIGITLKVKPRINDDSSITMDIDQTVESIAPSTAQTADIVTNKRNITTRVLIENDEVLVLGGLIQNDVTDSKAQIPVLGDLPLVGRLFRSTSTEVTKKNLMVFIHPHILATNAEGSSVAAQRYRELRDEQLNINRKVDRIFIPESAPLLPNIAKPTGIETPQSVAPVTQ